MCPVWLPLGRMIMFEYLGDKNEKGGAAEGVMQAEGNPEDGEAAEEALRVGSDESTAGEGEGKDVPPVE